jgi:FKBP-type peptidyl-prolyl cis-trans isomerase
MKFKFFSFFCFAFLLACSSDESNNCENSNCTNNTSNSEQSIIESYVASKGWVANVTCDGVYYILDTPGSTVKPTRCSSVTVHYEGKLLNGTKFDSSYDRGTPATFSLNQVIEGWKSGIPVFGEGGTGRLIIPPSLAYGVNGTTGIPGNSTLVFEIELIDVQ